MVETANLAWLSLAIRIIFGLVAAIFLIFYGAKFIMKVYFELKKAKQSHEVIDVKVEEKKD